MRPQEMFPQSFIDELLRIHSINKDWTVTETKLLGGYSCRMVVESYLAPTLVTGSDLLGTNAISRWLGDGPKAFAPTVDQCQALENVEVNIPATDYAQSYPAILIRFPKECSYGTVEYAICHLREKLIVVMLSTKGHKEDITTTISKESDTIVEEAINKFDVEVAKEAPQVTKALRVALNSCLMLVGYPHTLSPAYEAEMSRDKFYAKETSPRGVRARRRIALAVMVAKFSQEIVFSRQEGGKKRNGESVSNGSEMPPHWRKGHWAMQPHGVGNTLRKRILRPPVFVRADLFLGGESDTSVDYTGK